MPGIVERDGAVARGVLLVGFAGVLWSLQAVALRLIEVAEPQQVVFWRSLGQFAGASLVLVALSRGHMAAAMRRAGRVALLGGLCVLCATTCFVIAVMKTTVANVVFVMAASPLVAALLARIVLGEALERRAGIAMIVALAGIGIMVSGGLAAGNVTGTLLAIATTLAFAGLAVVARWGRGIDMLPAIVWGAMLAVGAGALLSGGDLSVPGRDAVIALLAGALLTAGGMTCFLFGARYVPAGILAFVSMTEIVLAPIWVWIGFGEVPRGATLAGGALVLGAIAYEAVQRIRDGAARAS